MNKTTKPLISVLTTGGTISGERDFLTGAIKPKYSHGWLDSLFSEIDQMAEITIKPALKPKLSEDLVPADWIRIAEAVEKEIENGVDGIVITHGTFTMGYTSAALNFMIRNSPVPIIMTGSQVPPTENESHVRSNLINSIYAAGYSDISGTNIVFAGDEGSTFSDIYYGTRTRKCFAWRMNCFRSIGVPPIGSIKNKKIIANNYNKINRKQKIEPIINKKFNDKVTILKAHPGTLSDCIDEVIKRGYKGIILEGYADGSFSNTNNQFISSIIRARKEGIPVFSVSQSIGNVTLTEYDSGSKMLDAGVVPLGDMLCETALVKLMWILGNTDDLNEIEKKMQISLTGEITNGSWLKSGRN